MRIYKFRGFHADEHGKTVIKLNGKEIRGKWYKGDLSTDGGYYIQEHAVIPETIGQYINKKDPDGEEIFEGDILKDIYSGIRYIASYEEDSDRFVAKYKTFYRAVLHYKGVKKIIGNVFENADIIGE